MDKNLEVADISSIKPLKLSNNSDLIYFNIAKTIDINILQGLEIDLQNKEVQVFQNGDVSFGVQVIEDITCKQIVPLFINHGRFEKKEISKIVNIFETVPMTGIKRRAIKKIQPRSLMNKN
ncbi:unnamed protein product [Paramecium octaurelia]|uniref:Uncharacterized protein n=1 Tax=Paramecium octaurelia TaxID=43137 RepID=A0A8S1T8K7_PAROT|nr:unnamed protein product [Paramecium octaurelia]